MNLSSQARNSARSEENGVDDKSNTTLLRWLEFTRVFINKVEPRNTSVTDTKKTCPFLMLQQLLTPQAAAISSRCVPVAWCLSPSKNPRKQAHRQLLGRTQGPARYAAATELLLPRLPSIWTQLLPSSQLDLNLDAELLLLSAEC